MKILLCASSNKRFIENGGYIELALKKLGHCVQVFDFRDYLLPFEIRKRLPALHDWDMHRINKLLHEQAKSFKPDMLFVVQGQTILPQTIIEIKKNLGLIAVNWFVDYPKELDYGLKVAKAYDYFFVNGTDALEKYLENGITHVKWLPLACEPDIHKPLVLDEKDKARFNDDIVFIGSLYPERISLFGNLADLQFGIWTWDKRRQEAGVSSGLRRCMRGGPLLPGDWVKLYNSAKIALNSIGHFGEYGEKIGSDKIQMTNARTFEILACGTFQLVDRKKDILTLFSDGEDLVCFKDGDELRDLAKYYLTHPEERRKISESGHKKVLEKHTYTHRMKEIFSYLKT